MAVPKTPKHVQVRLWLAVGAIVAAISLLDFFMHGPLTQADAGVNGWVTNQQASGWHMHDVGDFLSWMGDGYVDAAVTAVAVLFALSWGDPVRAVAMAGAELAAAGVIWSVKHLLGRPLPEQAIDFGQDYAFPSGHTMGATVGAGLLAFGLLESYVATHRVERRRANQWRALAFMGWIAVAVLTGAGRVLDQTHWVNDIVAAWAFSAIILVAMVVGVRWYYLAKGRSRGSVELHEVLQ